jgi:N-carbamoylputrescine amidase
MPKIALLQLEASEDTTENMNKTKLAIERAAEGGAQIVCTQELFNTLYFCDKQDGENFNLAVEIPGEMTTEFSELAKRLKVVIVVSTFEKRAKGIYHNTAFVIDADGSYMGKYRKMHIPQDPCFEEKFYFTPSDDGYRVFDTQFGKLGVLICWDQWYPEAARLTALMGAEILIYPTAIGWLEEDDADTRKKQYEAWQTIQRSHAIANGCFVAAINRCGKEAVTEFWGQSFVADAFGKVIAEGAVDEETIVYADLDFSEMDAQRCIWPFFRDRRVDSYGGITKRFLDDHHGK